MTERLAGSDSVQSRSPVRESLIARHIKPSELSLTTLQTSLHADRPFAPPRFDPGLPTGPGGIATADPGISPDAIKSLRSLLHDNSFAVIAQQAAGRTWIEA